MSVVVASVPRMITEGTFTVSGFTGVPIEEERPVVTALGVGVATMEKQYEGGVEGRSTTLFTSAFDPERGVGTYVAMESFEGSLDGRAGTFNFVHAASTSGADRSDEHFLDRAVERHRGPRGHRRQRRPRGRRGRHAPDAVRLHAGLSGDRSACSGAASAAKVSSCLRIITRSPHASSRSRSAAARLVGAVPRMTASSLLRSGPDGDDRVRDGDVAEQPRARSRVPCGRSGARRRRTTRA